MENMLVSDRLRPAIELYTQSPMAQRIAAQEQVLSAILKRPTTSATVSAGRRAVRKVYKQGAENVVKSIVLKW